MRPFALVVLAIATTAACARDHTPAAGGSPTGPSVISEAPTPPAVEAARIGETVHGMVADGLPSCTFESVGIGRGGLCQTHTITAPASGALKSTLRWSADAPLTLFLKRADGTQIDMACCGPSPLVLLVPVEMNASYRVEVAYGGRPPGYPHIAPVDYTLDTELSTTNIPLASARALLFGDARRTQYISSGRLEVLTGPKAGAVAGFDPVTGIYEIRELPSGFVEVRVSADGFAPLTDRIPVGLSVAKEYVLQRLEQLPDVDNELLGSIYDGPVGGLLLGDVKVEILDGPLAGVFTFSWSDFGWYQIEGLPRGLVHVRASAPTLEPQTSEVFVDGSTRLDFEMKRNR